MPIEIHSERFRKLKEANTVKKRPVIYWMQRDQRFEDNWALLFAQRIAIENDVPLIVCFNIVSSFLNATIRQYDFMLKGLKETQDRLLEYNIPLVFTFGAATESLLTFLESLKPSFFVTDFNPLRTVKEWKKKIIESIDATVYEVDAHNITPAFWISQKQEYGAYTLRPKIQKVLSNFLREFPKPQKMPYSNLSVVDFDMLNVEKTIELLNVDKTIKPLEKPLPGAQMGFEIMNEFIKERLKFYANLKNDPTVDGTSNLSPYLHFGQISPQRVALEVIKLKEKYPESAEAFLEELIVRRELADNFCLYNENYDSLEGFPDWARKSLEKHVQDKREYVYTLEDLENAETHDSLWNAAQLQLLKTGYMHGYMRMYWAKKILEWTTTPAEALKYAIYLNDKYELDGRDPNGYAGIAWAIGGVHHRPWKERTIFGMVQYMSFEGCKRKFDVEKYIERWYNE
ncbi:deoxyribodipyrimidine photo-lyase [Fervidobacterium gondwanense]|uniref:deoxyribodipyrimidine photo-lyase n=1 Tax=Fervidobacterium gondwanense TaxID=44754 RepID=UPI003C787971